VGEVERRASSLVNRMKVGNESGVLAFPLSCFTDDGEAVDTGSFAAHLRWHMGFGPGALFVCCGTGEFTSLTVDEYSTLVATAVTTAAGEIPIIAGVGYGWPLAQTFAKAAEAAGADGILLLPHYLVAAPSAGVLRHVRQVASASALPLIVYQRGLAMYSAKDVGELVAIPSVIGLKDSMSDFAELQHMTIAAPDDFLFFNGTPTAELQYRPYASIGIPAYSSAVHSCTPEIARAFFAAAVAGDTATMDMLLVEFYYPLIAIRDRAPGYAVALIKEAARLRGHRVGPVRAPLVDPTDADSRDLEVVIRHGLEIVSAEF